MRRARRACYGAVSDVDARLGELLAALAEAGFADDTAVVFTSDHGDMLGERGMWFKMSFLEHSARVPLIVRAPRMFRPRRVPHAVSLIDLLPTLVEIARDGRPGDYATPLEGRSLLPHLSSGDGHDEAMGEYFAEGVATPMFMVRRGARKLVHAQGDPPQYFDLAADPRELRNLAADPAYRTEVDVLLAELDRRYDRGSLAARVIESQRRRRFLKGVMRSQGTAWDYQPRRDAARAWVRSTLPIFELEKRARFPRA